MTLYLLKVHLQTFHFIPITQKCQILIRDTLVANERYVYSNRDINGNKIRGSEINRYESV